MASIMLKGREIPLIYTVYELKQVQEEIAPLNEFQYIVLGRNKNDENDSSQFGNAQQLDAIAKLVRILGNAGLEENGEAPNLTDKMILRAMKPADIVTFLNACMEAINEGMATEFQEKQDDGPKDVILEELNKKKQTES